MRRTRNTPPTSPERSELYLDCPDIAVDLWEAGFRPIMAKDVQVGQQIAYLPSLFGFPMTDKWEKTTVTEVIVEDYNVIIKHTRSEHGGGGEADDGQEVWVK